MAGSEEVDPALVRAAQRGDPMALGELMEILAPYVGRICGPIALQDGPDAAQEALILVLRGLRGLRDIEGLDEVQAGRILAVPPGTVRSRLFRARLGFRKAWGS